MKGNKLWLSVVDTYETNQEYEYEQTYEQDQQPEHQSFDESKIDQWQCWIGVKFILYSYFWIMFHVIRCS